MAHFGWHKYQGILINQQSSLYFQTLVLKSNTKWFISQNHTEMHEVKYERVNINKLRNKITSRAKTAINRFLPSVNWTTVRSLLYSYDWAPYITHEWAAKVYKNKPLKTHSGIFTSLSKTVHNWWTIQQ